MLFQTHQLDATKLVTSATGVCRISVLATNRKCTVTAAERISKDSQRTFITLVMGAFLNPNSGQEIPTRGPGGLNGTSRAVFS